MFQYRMFFLQLAAIVAMVSMNDMCAQPNAIGTNLELLEQELARNKALLKSLSAHIQLQEQQREALYQQESASLKRADPETLMYTHGEPDPAMISDVVYDPDHCISMSAPIADPSASTNKRSIKNQPQSIALKKALASMAKKQFDAAHRALMDLSQKTQAEDYPLALYWLGMLDLYQNNKPDLAARWFSKAYPFWEKSETNQEKIFSAYILLHLTQALMQQSKKEDAMVVFGQCEQCIKKIKDKPKKLTLAVNTMNSILSGRSAVPDARQTMVPNAAISTPQENADSTDDEDDQYSSTEAV